MVRIRTGKVRTGHSFIGNLILPPISRKSIRRLFEAVVSFLEPFLITFQHGKAIRQILRLRLKKLLDGGAIELVVDQVSS